MDLNKAKRYSAWLEITIYLYIAFLLITRAITKYYIKDIDDNFSKHRNKPCAIVAGPLTGRDSRGIMQGNIGNKSTGIFKIFMKLLQPIFKLMAKMFIVFKNSINKIRNMLSPIRNYFYTATKMFYDKIEDFTIGILYSAHKMRNSMKRSMSGFNLMMHTLEHSRNNLLSVIRSSPVKFTIKFASAVEWIIKTGFICFDKDTFICLQNKTYVKIYELKLGDILEDGSVVIALHTFKNDKPIYEYDSIYVSGDHMVKESGDWVKVSCSKKGKPVSIIPELLYCLSTTTGTVKIKDYLFKDFEGSSNKHTNLTINSLILMHLNRSSNKIVNYPNNFAYESKYLENGFHSDTLIITEKGPSVYIKNIKIGDILEGGNKVLGTVIISGDHVSFYNDKGIIVTSNTKTMSNGIWKNIEKTDAKKLRSSYNIAYNIITEKHIIPVYPKHIYRDYIEVYDQEIERQIDMLTSVTLNTSTKNVSSEK